MGEALSYIYLTKDFRNCSRTGHKSRQGGERDACAGRQGAGALEAGQPAFAGKGRSGYCTGPGGDSVREQKTH